MRGPSYSDRCLIIGLMAGYLMGTLWGTDWWGFILVGIGALLWYVIAYAIERVWRRLASR